MHWERKVDGGGSKRVWRCLFSISAHCFLLFFSYLGIFFLSLFVFENMCVFLLLIYIYIRWNFLVENKFARCKWFTKSNGHVILRWEFHGGHVHKLSLLWGDLNYFPWFRRFRKCLVRSHRSSIACVDESIDLACMACLLSSRLRFLLTALSWRSFSARTRRNCFASPRRWRFSMLSYMEAFWVNSKWKQRWFSDVVWCHLYTPQMSKNELAVARSSMRLGFQLKVNDDCLKKMFAFILYIL